MKELKELRSNIYKLTREQKEKAWNTNDFDKSVKLREEEKQNYEKYKLLDGIIKASEKKGEK